MNSIFFKLYFFDINFFTAVFIIIFMSIWTRFSINMLLRLSKRVGLIMINEDMPTPQSTETNNNISLFKPSECNQCKHQQDLKTFIPFIPFFRKHNHNCILDKTYKNQKNTLFTEIFFLFTTIIIVSLLLFSHSHYALETLFVYGLSIPLILFDINFHWVPDRFSFLFLFSGLILSPLAPIYDRVYTCVGYTAMLTFLFMLSSFIRKQDVSSSGDILLIAGAGAWTGSNNIFYMSIFLLGISLILSLNTVIQNYKNKEDISGFPFAPAIMGATVMIMLFNLTF